MMTIIGGVAGERTVENFIRETIEGLPRIHLITTEEIEILRSKEIRDYPRKLRVREIVTEDPHPDTIQDP